MPLLRQPKGSYECGQYCVKMVLAKFNIQLDISTITKYCNARKRGISEPGIAVGLLQAGIHPTLHTFYDGEVFWGKYAQQDPTSISASFRRRAQKVKNSIRRQAYKDLGQLIEKECVVFEIVTSKVLQREIDYGRPWIAGVETNHLYNASGTSQHHFVVINGYDKEKFYINDPARGGYSIDKDRLLAALHQSDGQAICVRGRNGSEFSPST